MADFPPKLETVWQCVGRVAPDRFVTTYEFTSARFLNLSGPNILVFGTLGHHRTWALLFDTTQDRPVAYETFGANGSMTGIFGRMPVPDVLRDALVECGAAWKGLWPDRLPERRRPKITPLVTPSEPIPNLPLDDLLPTPDDLLPPRPSHHDEE